MITIFGISFGSKFVSTKKYESFLTQEKTDFERFTSFENSELLKRFNTLNTTINSGDFEKKVRELKTAKYKDTEQYRQLQQYNALKSASDIKTYLKFVKAGKLGRMNSIANSDAYKEYLELHKLINSGEFHAAKAKKDFKQTDYFVKLQRYNSLLKDSDVKFYLKTEKTSEYRTITKLDKSERLETFFKLEGIIQSDEFVEHKTFMEDKKRFDKSDEALLIDEFKTLSKNHEITWYLDKKKNDPFKEIRKWEATFDDDFDGVKLNSEKWMTGYYWGKALMNDNYVIAGDKQFFSENNIEMRDSYVRISTKKETLRGKVWDTTHGFTTQEFDYSSGIISTGQSFRQKYGKFEAKVRFSQAHPVNHSFWMVGERIAPQIDIFKTSVAKGKAIESGIHQLDKNKNPLHRVKKVDGAKFNDEFYIYTLEWSQEAIIWKINGKEVHRETNQIPSEAMYLTFCTVLPQAPENNMIPAYLDIDWIRCYQRI